MDKQQKHDFYAVANTLSASWLELKLARMFGTKTVVVDTVGMKVTQSRYRGKVYFMGYKK